MLLSLKTKPHILLWFGFVATTLLACTNLYFFVFSRGFRILSVMAAIHIVLGVWLLITTRFAWRTVILVVAGIGAGQWWLILLGWMYLSVSAGRFAP